MNRRPAATRHLSTAMNTAILLSFAAANLTTTAGADEFPTVVMSGLDNPRGLAIGPEGAVYVVEAGRGGSGPILVTPRGQFAYGPTGAVTRLWHGRQERIATGLPSIIGLVGMTSGEVTGAHDIAMLGRGQAYLTVGLGADPALRSQLGEVGEQFGRLIRLLPNGRWQLEKDLASYESANNPDAPAPRDSNVFGLLKRPGSVVVADAGANDLLEVRANGEIGLLAVFAAVPNPGPIGPPIIQPVPTAVTEGPDGALYVGQLTGAPFLPGSARVFRVAAAEPPEVFLDGFTTIVDLDFGPDGSLYVLQHASGLLLGGPGSLIRVAPDGTRSTIVGGLSRPTSVAVSPDGSIYVSNRGTSVGSGEVLRINP